MVKPVDPTGYVALTSPSPEDKTITFHRRQERIHEMHEDVVAEPYTPSLNNFDKPKSYMEDVQESVASEMKEKQTGNSGSPSWAWKAQKKLNHTGEQPLIVQEYLSSYKKEQEDGVLPAKKQHTQRFRSKSAGANNRGELYQLSITSHQFLTATEMPNESEKIVDHRHGRPTRTSLLRARKRIPSAPGVKATVEVRTDLHLQQSLAAKREEKYKTVDVPEELLPITDSGETVHQFLVGARYNRGHYRDAKCLTRLGLYVCRDDISNCFLRPTSSQSTFHPKNLAHVDVMRGQMSASSSSIRSSLRPKSARPSSRSREAWTASGQVSAPHTSPTDSRDGFSHKEDPQRPIPKNTVIDGSCLNSSRSSKVSESVDEESCILCQSRVPLCKGSIPAWSVSHRKNSNPARLWSGKKKFGSVKNEITNTKESLKDEDETSKSVHPSGGGLGKETDVQHMALQQYHLRILGTKVGVKSGIPSAPRSNFLYQNVKKTQPNRRLTSARTKKNVNVNNNTDKERECLEDPQGNEIERPASQISVHISTKSLSEDDGNSLHDKDLTTGDETKIDLESSEDKNIISDLGNISNGEEDSEIEELESEIEVLEGSGSEEGGVENRTVEEQNFEGGSIKGKHRNSEEREDGCQEDVGIHQVPEEQRRHDEGQVFKEESDIGIDTSARDGEKNPQPGDSAYNKGDEKEGSDCSVPESEGQGVIEKSEAVSEVESKCTSNPEDITGQPDNVSVIETQNVYKTDVT
ncbi:hypothetical protein HOLleu_27025 [Holothuria leucospilota]|uniref:Uncharacterized protein n=1 Tax=Holothuria leucospilota TaxID=206669 RepID=A0A9Q1H383_HOLLE|nr:hypothetical protein HOLleu_27025 [Holothuria leucospilota]